MAIGVNATDNLHWSEDTWLHDLYWYLNKTVHYLNNQVIDDLHAELSGNNSHLNDSLHNATHEEHDAHGSKPTPIFFIFTACALGALVRTILKKIPQLPYTVMLLIFGALFGILSSKVPSVKIYTSLVNMDPHTLIYVFLPVLIFESAYAMEAHTFFKSFLQIVILAIPGMFLASFFTALFCINVFQDYDWDWTTSLLFGSIISATDPVAVVALLKELGASKQLAILLEGESLLNDGAAIVLFNVFLVLATPGTSMTPAGMVLSFVKVTLGGPIFGFIMAKLTIFWLVNIFNDALTEITITLASTYITFYVGEGFLGVSGVLAVVVLGVILSSNRTSISPEVETFLHRFWEMLAYLANTLIFIIVGVVITEKAVDKVTGNDIVLNLALFCALVVIRAIVIMMFSPLLSRIGYGLPWRNCTVMIWGGLRGAVGLTLALMVAQKPSLDVTGVTQSKILLHTAGIVLLTLVINATTIQPLLKVLGMSEISIPKRMAMASAVRNLQNVANTHISMYKTDRFLADADWDLVSKDTEIEDPYKTLDEEAELDQLTNFERHSKCPTCDSSVPNEPSPKEMAEMKEESRLRILKAEKISYWKQFEHGMLSREAVRKLVELVDVAADEEDGYVEIDEIRKTWQIKGFYAYVRRKLEQWQSGKPGGNTIPPPRNRCLRGCYKVCVHAAFEIILQCLIMMNIIAIIVELVEESKLCSAELEERYGNAFKIINYIFIVIYSYEAIFKICAFRKWYFKSKWNLFDFIILWMSCLDIILDLTVFSGADTNTCDESTGTIFSPGVLKIVKSVRLLRLLRSLRLVKTIIPQMMDVVNHQINKNLRFGYDVGKGYVMGEEEVTTFIDSMIDNDKIAKEIKMKMTEARLEIIKELGLLQKMHPGVAVSIKTQQASRRILNNMRDGILQMRSEGVLDDAESQKLEVMVEMRMKKLLKIPPTIQPPPPERIIGNLSWVQGDGTLIEYIKHNARLVTMGDGEKLNAESDPKGGIYVIISGLVKVDKYLDQKSTSNKAYEKISDYLTTGGVLGEMSLLTHKPSHVVVTCETSVQLYHISYDAIQAALELFTEEPSLEYRLWRVCAIRIATVILRNQALFMNWTQEKIKIYLEKSVIFLKKSELPEGGKFVDFPTFDINSLYMSEIILIHGVAEDATNGDMYQGPCFIPNKVDRLILIPGKTDKHVITIIPRDTDGLVLERSKSGSAMNVAGNKNPTSLSAMCLSHASKQRVVLTTRISELKLEAQSGMVDKLHRSLTSLREGSPTRTKMKTNADYHYNSETCMEVVTDGSGSATAMYAGEVLPAAAVLSNTVPAVAPPPAPKPTTKSDGVPKLPPIYPPSSEPDEVKMPPVEHVEKEGH